MAAQSLETVTLDLPNPQWAKVDQPVQRILANISFTNLISFDIQTLSTNTVNPGALVQGLLYVPDLDPTDPCINASAPYVPQNVTRQANLPNNQDNFVAMAPWVSATCTQNYLAAARMDPVRGFLFFLPNNGTATPPPPDSSAWGLNDGGQWKGDNQYPVYAIPGASGMILMQASAQYSGNMTDVPFGHQLTTEFDPRDYVRLFVDIDTGSAGSLPSLWVFLLIVLGILLAIIGLTSLTMHWLQRRRRQALRRRVANGEVDLEALGIKRLTVPVPILNKMPLYTYGSGAPVTSYAAVPDVEPEKSASSANDQLLSPAPTQPLPALVRSSSYRPSPLQQPTCAICLEDFVPPSSGCEGTTVRELPCHHIFHPECVDTFLRDSSSLCPMCKKSALPKGYCPRVVTNAMVRRERVMHRIRDRVTTLDNEADDEAGDSILPLFRPSGGTRAPDLSGLSHLRMGARRVSSAPTRQSASVTTPTAASPTLVHSTTTTSAEDQQAPQVQPPSTQRRREWARQRAIAMLGRRAPLDPDGEEARQTPAWRKAIRGIFPGAGQSTGQ